MAIHYNQLSGDAALALDLPPGVEQAAVDIDTYAVFRQPQIDEPTYTVVQQYDLPSNRGRLYLTGIDISGPDGHLTVRNYDAKNYLPRHALPNDADSAIDLAHVALSCAQSLKTEAPNSAKIISRMVTLAGGWAMRNAPDLMLAYHSAEQYQYFAVDAPDSHVIVQKHEDESWQVFGIYTGAQCILLTADWASPNYPSDKKCYIPKSVRGRVSFHEQTHALSDSSIAESIAAMALDAW